jgi:5-methyltetrahydrofolate corrinoid/iron sulfur protein methyltransferase
MLLIGNQFRLTRPVLAAAVSLRREAVVRQLARQQVDAGANWLLVDMGPQHHDGADSLAWLVQTIHSEVQVPLVLRSDNPHALEAGLEAAKDMVMIDATLPAVDDLAPYLALAKRSRARLAFSACPEGLPVPTDERVSRVTEILIPQALEAGLLLEHLYVDPLVAALTCDQPKVPATVETLRLLKVAADPAPNTLVHLDDIADGVADAAKPFIVQAYVTMLLASGLDALVGNLLDPELMDVLRVVRERDPSTAYDRLLLRLFDVTKVDGELDIASIDTSDPDQVSLFKTVQVLTNKLIYADSYLLA